MNRRATVLKVKTRSLSAHRLITALRTPLAMDEQFSDAMEDAGSDSIDGPRLRPTPSSSRTPSPGRPWGVGSLLDLGWNTAKRTAHAALNPISTTKELAGVMATSAQSALARTIGVDETVVAQIMTKPLELLISASNETRELTSLWIQFLVSLIDVLRTQEVTESVQRSQDAGLAILQILRSNEFAAMKDSVGAFVASEEATSLVREVAQQSQRWVSTLGTPEAKESTIRLIAFVEKVVALLNNGTAATPASKPSPSRSPARTEISNGSEVWANLLNVIDDLNEIEELLTDHEAMNLRKLCRTRNPGLMTVYQAYLSRQNQARFLRGLREVLEDVAV